MIGHSSTRIEVGTDDSVPFFSRGGLWDGPKGFIRVAG